MNDYIDKNCLGYRSLKDNQIEEFLGFQKRISVKKHFNKLVSEGLVDLKKNITLFRSFDFRNKLDDSTRKRLRYKGDFVVFSFGGRVDVEYCVSYYYNVLRKAGLVLDTPFPIYYLSQSDTALEEVSQHAFSLGDKYSIQWRFLCHLKRLRDYDYTMEFADLVAEVKYWVTPKAHFYNGSELQYRVVFEEEVDKLLNKMRLITVPEISFREFVLNRTLWANSGSGFMGVNFNWDKQTRGYSRTKWLRAWSLSDDELLHYATTCSPYQHKVHQKPEIAKIRGVIGADLRSYLHMKYCYDYFLKFALGELLDSPLLLDGSERWNMWKKIASAEGYKLPLDQSEFDQQQLKADILYIIEKFRSRAPDQMIAIFDMILYGLRNATVLIKNQFNSVTLHYENGVLSGWYWTALLDTILSQISFSMAKRILGERLIDNEFKMQHFLGDDVQCVHKDYKSCLFMVVAYKSMGFKVNMKKCFISDKRDEFLRKVITKDRITGYPARSIVPLLIASPEKEREYDPDLLYSRCQQWAKLANRLGVTIDKTDIVRDIVGLTGWLKKDVTLFLQQPTFLGGLGIDPQLQNNVFEYIDVEYEREEVNERSALDLKGLSGFSSNVKSKLIRMTLTRNKNKTKVRAIPVKKQLKVDSTRFNFGDWYDVDGNLFDTKPLWRPKYKPEVGAMLSQILDIKPENYQQFENLFGGCTSRLRAELLKGELNIKLPFIAGVSEDYLSPIFQQKMWFIQNKLRYMHRATYFDFLRCCFYLQLNFSLGDYQSTE